MNDKYDTILLRLTLCNTPAKPYRPSLCGGKQIHTPRLRATKPSPLSSTVSMPMCSKRRAPSSVSRTQARRGVDLRDFSVAGCIKDADDRINGDAVAHHALRYRVGDGLDRHDSAAGAASGDTLDQSIHRNPAVERRHRSSGRLHRPPYNIEPEPVVTSCQ